MKPLPLIAVMGLTCVAACVATETGNPFSGQRLTLAAASSSEDVVLAPAQGRVHVEQAFVVLDRVRFVPEGACDAEDGSHVDIAGPLVVDLLATETFDLWLPAERYCRIRLPMERLEEPLSGVPDLLVDHALLLAGTTGSGTPFVIRSRDKREAELRSRSTAFSVDAALGHLLLTYDVSAFLRGVDLDAATPDGDGSVRIDEEHNRALLELFESNVRGALELFRDLDRDGRLDDDERSESIASGG